MRNRALVLELRDDGLDRLRRDANAMPIDPPEGEKIMVLTPITLPSRSKLGPPESPLLMGASI